jgi:hypothetical protein
MMAQKRRASFLRKANPGKGDRGGAWNMHGLYSDAQLRERRFGKC